MKKNRLQFQELGNGMVQISYIHDNTRKEVKLTSAIAGIRFYLNVMPENVHLSVFEKFVISNFTNKYEIIISNMSKGNDLYNEVNLRFESVSQFNTTQELYTVINLIADFNQTLQLLMHSKYDGYHVDMYCEDKKTLEEIFIQANKDRYDNLNFYEYKIKSR